MIVDLFAGAGGASCGIRAALGRDPDVAVNHSPTALAIHEANHPDTLHLAADVWEVDPRETAQGRDVELLWASPDCFPAGTLILTPEGLQPIEEIRAGDLVLTHKGRWCRVASTLAREADTVEVRGYGHFGLVTTPNHPFYSKHITRRYPGRKRPDGKREQPTKELVENPFWPRADAMAGKLWATPHSFPASAIPTCSGAQFDDGFFYFVGRWLGDGSINKGDVEICTGAADFDRLRQIFNARAICRADGSRCVPREGDRGSTRFLAWGNASLARWLTESFGAYSEGKRIPFWCLAMQRSWREALLAGYVDSDGHVGVRVETSSVSKRLSIAVRLLAVSLGKAAALYLDPGRDGVIEGRPFVGRDAYRVAWREDLQRQTTISDETHTFFPVREVKPGTRQVVHSLEVEGDESYVADGIVVHNCTHHSRAKGGKPKDSGLRSLAWVVRDWARDVRPRVIIVENVSEFLSWGPLDEHGQPIKERRGETFDAWVGALDLLGYRVEWRVLAACDYGAPTSRRRLFVVARCDGEPITWPEPTHGPGLLPYRTAAECIDWSIPVPSIFDRPKPLADATQRRIAAGLKRFVLEHPKPYVVKGGAPIMIQTSYGERPGQRPRYLDLHQPLGTVVGGGIKHGLVMAWLAKHYGGVTGVPFDGRPLDTVTATDHHALCAAEVGEQRPEMKAWITAYYGAPHEAGQDLREPLRTVVGADRFGLCVTDIADLGMRMLEPHELLRAQFGRFAESYDLSAAPTKAAKVKAIGNSVCPELAEALVRAQLGDAMRRAA